MINAGVVLFAVLLVANALYAPKSGYSKQFIRIKYRFDS